MQANVLLLGLLLAGCASDLPRAIREAPAEDIRPAQALGNPEGVRGAAVRWGGAIAAVENRRDETWLEVVERPLARDGQPRNTDQSGGRFLARVSGFVDPVVYAQGRLITITGNLETPTTRAVGDYPYRYPVVGVTDLYLWPKEPEAVHHHYYSPYWYDPWYPWGYPYPYRRLR
jgi:outer membrane lipoprotein